MVGRRTVILLAAALAGGTQGARADSLIQALADAYAGNAEIQAERQRQRQTDEALPEAQAGWRPSVEIQGGVDRQHQYFGLGLPGIPPVQDITPRTAALTVDQPIWHGGAIEAGIDRARSAVAAGQSTLEAAEQAQLLAAAGAYLDAFRDHEVVGLNQALIDVLTLNQHDVQVTFDAGAATETDTAQAAARLQGAVAGHLAARARYDTSLAHFRNLVGRDAGPLDPPAPLGELPATEAEAEALGNDHNPQVTAALATLEAARHQVEIATAALLPHLDAVGTLEHADDELIKGVRQNAAAVGLQATVPLYQGADYARIRAAKEGVALAERRIDAARREVRESADAAWNALQAARAQQDQYRAQIAANAIALRDTAKEVTAGTRTRLDVLNAQQELFASRVSLVSAQHDTILAGFRLQSAVGRFTPSALGLGIADYDSAAHLKAVEDKWFGIDPP